MNTDSVDFAKKLIADHQVKEFLGVLLDNGLPLSDLTSAVAHYRYVPVNESQKVQNNITGAGALSAEIHFG